MKRHLSLILAMLLIIAALPAMSVASADDTPTITVLQPIFNNYDPSDTPIQKEFLAKLNEHLGTPVNLDFTYYGSGEEYTQKLNMAINAADLTWDIIFVTGLSGSDGTFQGVSSLINSYGKDGYFVNIMDHKDIMPNVMNRIEECGTLFNYMYDENGDLYFIPNFTENQGGTLDAARRGPIIDCTVFDENNIPYPTDLESLYEGAKKLKEIYPDSVPIVPYGSGAASAMSGMDETAFATRGSGNLGFDGTEYVVEAISDEFRAMLSYGNKLYKEGLIAADYAAWDNDMNTASTTNGKSFVFFGIWYPSIDENGYSHSNSFGVEGHQYANIRYALAENEGGWWEMRGSMKKISATPYNTLCINANAKDVELCCKVLDYVFTEECHNLLALGFQGQSWDYDENGLKVFINEYKGASGSTPEENPQIALGIQNSSCASGIMSNFGVSNTGGLDVKTRFVMPDGSIEVANRYLFAQEHWTYDNMEPENCVDVSLPSISQDDYAEVTEIGGVLWTYVSECMGKFYQGEMDVNDDDTWNAYVEQCKAYGTDRLCEIYNKYIEGVDFYPGKTAK